VAICGASPGADLVQPTSTQAVFALYWNCTMIAPKRQKGKAIEGKHQ
jgi:hypothetical protein